MSGYYRLRFRYRRRGPAGQAAGLALAAAVAVAGAGGVARVRHHHPSLPPTTAIQQSWARALLTAEGFPRSACNLGAVTAWEHAEGSNLAWRNPLDTTQPEPGSWDINSVSVQAYPSWRAGLRATIATLGNGRYSAVISALAAGDDAQSVAASVAASPWGTSAFGASC